MSMSTRRSAAARAFQDGLQVVEYAVRLNDDVAADGIICGRITRRLAGNVKKPFGGGPPALR